MSDIKIKENGTNVTMPLVMLISMVGILLFAGWGSYAWISSNYVSTETYTKEQVKLMKILRVIANNTSQIKADVANQRFALIKSGIKVDEIIKPDTIMEE